MRVPKTLDEAQKQILLGLRDNQRIRERLMAAGVSPLDLPLDKWAGSSDADLILYVERIKDFHFALLVLGRVMEEDFFLFTIERRRRDAAATQAYEEKHGPIISDTRPIDKDELMRRCLEADAQLMKTGESQEVKIPYK